jgi:hypothetical protein
MLATPISGSIAPSKRAVLNSQPNGFILATHVMLTGKAYRRTADGKYT